MSMPKRIRGILLRKWPQKAIFSVRAEQTRCTEVWSTSTESSMGPTNITQRSGVRLKRLNISG